MKQLKCALLALTAMVSMQAVQAQTVDEVIGKYVEAMGGKEKIMSVKTLKMTGGLSVQGFDVSLVITTSHGIGSRTDISVPGMGEGFQVMNTTKGWNYMPFQGQTSPEEVSEEQVKAGQAQLDLQGSLVNYKEKGNQVELLGKEKVDGVECYKLKLTNKAGKVSTLYLDAATYYRIKTVSKQTVNGEDMEVETSYSDFKKVDGLVFAHSQTSPRGTITFTAIEVNKPVDESIYVVK